MKTKKDGGVSRTRRMIGDLLLASVIFLTVDVAAVMLHKIHSVVLKSNYQIALLVELIVYSVLLLFALDVRFSLFTRARSKFARILGWVSRIAVVLFSALFLFCCGKVVTGGMIKNAGQADYAVVLGMALENGKPAKDLLARLDTAVGYIEEYPQARLILTGGNADESGLTEAAVMRELLTKQGVPEDRLILEDKARSTEENFANTAGMLPADEPIVLISSNYHMDRAVRTAKSAGFSQVMRLPAPSGFLTYGSNMMWEVILDLYALK